MNLNYLMKTAIYILVLAYSSSYEGRSQTGLPDSAVRYVEYGPSKTELLGSVVIEQKYGPPGYGEEPKSDKKVKIFALHLRRPISARASEQEQSPKAVNEVELFFRKRHGVNSWDSVHRAVGHCVRAVGQIEPSQVGSEFTSLIMNVDELKVLRSGCTQN